MRHPAPRALIGIWERMLRIRRFEEKICALYCRQEMKTPVHLYIGQEAVAAGVCAALKRKDYVFGTHRSHGLYIAKGGDLRALAAELYGKKTGCARGKGGSMHVIDPRRRICGTTAIVGGNIPLAVGAALTASLRKTGEIAAAFFGDGAVDEGVFFESMNFAALKKLPVIFVCENNFYAVHSHISARQPLDNIYERGQCFGIPGARIDGNDAAAVYAGACEAVSRARSGRGPTLLECRTYRWKTHVGPESDEDLEFPPCRGLRHWMKRDPLALLRQELARTKVLTPAMIREAIRQVDGDISAAFAYAKKCAAPGARELRRDLFAPETAVRQYGGTVRQNDQPANDKS